LVEQKSVLLRKLGRKQLTLSLQRPLDSVPSALDKYRLELSADGRELVYTFDADDSSLARGGTAPFDREASIASVLARVSELGIDYNDLRTTERSLEDIFVSLVRSAR
jgi:ABC-2 type transport system ATP-binding protein